MSERLHIVVQGRVQGVGYRYGAHARAVELGLRGWVRNLPDGRVEGDFEGDRAPLTEMLAWCRKGPRFARVDAVEAMWLQDPEGYERFDIRP